VVPLSASTLSGLAFSGKVTGAPRVTPTGSETAGIIFDERGEAWPALQEQLVHQLGGGTGRSQVLNAIRNLGFVHVEPVSDALVVTFDPSAVSRLAAVAAFYEISAHPARRLILASPGTDARLGRCEIFDNVGEGLKRLDEAANRARNPLQPKWLQGARPSRRGGPASATRPAAGVPGGGRLRLRSRAGDRSVRLSRPLAAISANDGWLAELLGFWGNARNGRRLPSDQSLDSLELLNLACGRAHIVDTSGSNPAGYRFRLWGAVNSYGDGYANRTLGEMPAGLMRDEAIADYRKVVAAGIPRYHLISVVENNLAYSYARLLLPLAQDGRRVDRLVVLINERRLPELGKP
jgi:hypothetical protein